MSRSWLCFGALASLAILGPLLTGSADPPSLAPGAAQLLPPGARADEAVLEGGGFVRAREIIATEGGLRLRSAQGWREIRGVRATSPVRSARLWLGTDHQGRSLIARLLHGARTSLFVASVATVVAVALGTGFGLAAAWARGALAAGLRIAVDGLLGLPRLLLLLMLGVTLRGSTSGVALAIGLASWMEVSRLVEAEARGLRRRPFVSAAVAAGGGPVRMAWLHLAPNLTPIVSVAAPLVATEAVLLESTLSFLGVAGGGADSWGRMVADGQRFLPSGWWLICFPGLLLSLTALAVQDLVRPRQRARLARLD